MNLKLAVLLGICVSPVVMADIVNLDTFKNRFDIPESARSVILLNVKLNNKVVNQLIKTPAASDDFNSSDTYQASGKTSAVELEISYDTFDGSQQSTGSISAYLPLSTFSESDLTTIAKGGWNSRIAVVKKYVELRQVPRQATITYDVCADLNFNSFNSSLSECDHIVPKTETASVNTLFITPKK